MSGRPWVMRMRWVDLLFAHWPVPAEDLRRLLPPDLELDTFMGRAYLGVVPFRMEDVAPRGMPPIPGLSAFPELNLRTYVTHRGRPGVWFLSLDAASPLTVVGARRVFHLPYVHARMTAVTDADRSIDYRSVRTDRHRPAAAFTATYAPTGPVELAAPSSFEDWLTARWRLFSVDDDGRVSRGEIRHRPWPLQPAWATIDAGELVAAHGLTLPDAPPHLRFSRRVDVRAWWPRAA